MLRYKIVSDGPHRRKYASSFPEQRISQIPAVDITKPIELNPTDLDAFTEETAINYSVLIGCIVAHTAAMAKAQLNRVLITFWSDKRGGVGMWIDDE